MSKKKQGETEAKPSGSKLKLILIVVVLLVMLAAGGGAAYFFLFRDTSHKAEPAAGAEHEAATEEVAAETAGAKEVLLYHPLESITVNLASPGPVRFLKVNMTIVTASELVVAAIDKHMPIIRNDLLSLLASQEFAVINTADGKQVLREQVKERITKILKQVHQPSGVEDVLFTELVMQ